MIQHGYPWQARPGTAGTATTPAVAKPQIISPVPRVALRPDEAAQSLGVSLGTLRAWERLGEAPPSLVAPGGRARLYPVAGLVAWAAERAAADQAQDADKQTESTALGHVVSLITRMDWQTKSGRRVLAKQPRRPWS